MASKTSTKHPYAAIEHRVIDSPAYADLSFSARSLLTLITRQLTKDNNGHLQATASYMCKFGICENTIARNIKELIAHGMIYRTCADRHKLITDNFKRIASKYAVTWLPIKRRDGLYLNGFVSCAWREWKPEIIKMPTSEMETDAPQICGQPLSSPPKFDAIPPPKTEDNELIPCRANNSTMSALSKPDRAGKSISRLPLVADGRIEPIKTFH